MEFANHENFKVFEWTFKKNKNFFLFDIFTFIAIDLWSSMPQSFE
jgi:hypothetical protein